MPVCLGSRASVAGFALALVCATSTLGCLPSGPAITVAGGGHASFGRDLDDDGKADGSYFGVGAQVQGDKAEGHFVCAMWGATAFLGLPVMGVEGKLTGAARQSDGRLKLTGTGSVDLGGEDQFFEDVPFEVTLAEGGPGTGSVKLTLLGTFDGQPGDTQPGNGNYELPEEVVESGFISIE